MGPATGFIFIYDHLIWARSKYKKEGAKNDLLPAMKCKQAAAASDQLKLENSVIWDLFPEWRPFHCLNLFYRLNGHKKGLHLPSQVAYIRPNVAT